MEDYFDDPEFQELIRQYIEYLHDTLFDMKKHLENNEFESIQKFGHNLKGTGGGYGFAEFTIIGKQLEITAKEKDTAQVADLLQRLTPLVNDQYCKTHRN